jgi:hypothetical protein
VAELTDPQRRTYENLIGTGPRPSFSADLPQRLRDRIEEALAGLELAEPLWLGKEKLTREAGREADGIGWDRIVVIQTSEARGNGMAVAAIAAALGTEPVDAVVRLLGPTRRPASSGAMLEEDVRRIFADPDVFRASDASPAPDGPEATTQCTPRLRNVPRASRSPAIAKLLTLEAVVRKMTSLPAEPSRSRPRTIREGLRRPGAVRSGDGFATSRRTGLARLRPASGWSSSTARSRGGRRRDRASRRGAPTLIGPDLRLCSAACDGS